MTMKTDFAIYYAGDAYSTAGKIMGRQSAGKAMIKGVARTWPDGPVTGLGPLRQGGQALAHQLQADGFKGKVRWSQLPDLAAAREAGSVYFPSPSPKLLAHLRNQQDPMAFSLMGATFTLSSAGAMDQVAELILPPFKPWDALICISECARTFTENLFDEMRDWWRGQAGDMRLNAPQLPVIPLGVDVPAFAPVPGAKAAARAAMGLAPEETVFLFSGRLSFHAKANPAPMYQALEKAAGETRVVCVEAGVFPNEAIRQAYLDAQTRLAPSVRFVAVDGTDEAKYRQAWQAADVFISLSDNIQETFGLTPVEAMAAGLPVVVADWNGYKETVRDGIDGFRIPTVLPPGGSGGDLALRHALEQDTYDMYIGRVSMATVVDPGALAEAIARLARDASLREAMGAAGLKRATEQFDWPIILRQYAELAAELGEIRRASAQEPPRPWPQRTDPFMRFAHFPSATLNGAWPVRAKPGAALRLAELSSLSMINYTFDSATLPMETIEALLAKLREDLPHTVGSLLAGGGQNTPAGVRALMWLWKFDLVQIDR